jgi:hypothetical protein
MRTLMVFMLALLALACWAKPAPPAEDEFIGPFPSWWNVKTDFGAKGDGKADDTAAIQKALEEIRKPESPKRVLYFPAGTYRITDTVMLKRETHTQAQGVCIFGENPETTVLKWDGPTDKSMLFYNPWYATMGRLTFDGQGKAKTAIQHGPSFTTNNELSDLIIKDVQFGIEAGMKAGIAETGLYRCRFYRCSKAAVSMQDFNSLDWYIWHCWFEDCGIGVTNRFGAGNFHVYESTFLRSKDADVMIKHCGYFTLYGNTSIGAKAFFVSIRAENWNDKETWGANTTLQQNAVYFPTDVTPIRIENNGPTMLLDNRFYTDAADKPVIWNSVPADQADVISVGNSFSRPSHYDVKGRLLVLDDKDMRRIRVALPSPVPHPFLPRVERVAVEVRPGADTAAIQAAIDTAARWQGERPVVHLPAGTYNIKQTLVIPAGSDLQLVGDGIIQATALNWAGAGEGPILRLEGPVRATLRQLGINGGAKGRCIVAEHLDAAGGRVFMQQVTTFGVQYGMVVNGLDNTPVILHDFGHDGLQVIGASPAPKAMTTLFCGASSRDKTTSQDAGINLYDVRDGGRCLVRDIWYEGSIWHFIDWKNTSGEFTYHSGNIAPYAGPTADSAIISLDNFRGKVLFSEIEPMNGPIRVTGGDATSKVLMLGLLTNAAPVKLDGAAPAAKVAFLNGRDFRKNGTGSDTLSDVGTADPDFLREMLTPLRTVLPQPLTATKPGTNDLRLYRVTVWGKEGIRLEGK